MRLKDEAIRRMGDLLLFDLDKIEEKEGHNKRNMESEGTIAYVRAMADAIKAGGTATVPPITIWQEDGKIYADEGHCRRRAHILARNEGAPVIGIRAYVATEGIAKSEAERTLNFLTSNNQLPPTPIEKANAIAELLSFNWQVQEIAKRLGCTSQAVNNIYAAPANRATHARPGTRRHRTARAARRRPAPLA